MHGLRITALVGVIVLLLGVAAVPCNARPADPLKGNKAGKAEVPVPEPPKRYKVEGGIIRRENARMHRDSITRPTYTVADSLVAHQMGVDMRGLDSARNARLSYVSSLPDSLAADSLGMTLTAYDSMRRFMHEIHIADSLILARNELNPDSLKRSVAGTMLFGEEAVKVLTDREKRRLERDERRADSAFVPYSRIFPDTMPISRMSAISMVVPGFSQLHNKQAWKIPILYGIAGTSAWMWHKQNQKYKPLKKEYDFLVARGASRGEIDPVQRKMIQRNTTRQLFMFATLGTYIYFIGEGAANHPGNSTSVKKATTLSTIFPGAGQMYNGSYWKVPIVIGGFAAMAYIIDWNNRGYKRFDTAITMLTDGDPNTVDEFNGRYTVNFLANHKKSYRRNRDLAIILTGALYLLNVIDAHVDAHLKDYDISDNLAMNIVPTVDNFASMSNGNSNVFSLSLQIKF